MQVAASSPKWTCIVTHFSENSYDINANSFIWGVLVLIMDKSRSSDV
jgi:hypothetical protein